MPRWYKGQIYADFQQKLFSLEHDISRKILPITFLAEKKRKYNVKRLSSLTQSLYFFVNVDHIIKVYPKLYLACKFKN